MSDSSLYWKSLNNTLKFVPRLLKARTDNPARLNNASNNNTRNFDIEWPAATIISVCFVAIWIFLIAVIKIMTNSTDVYFNQNKYDLILYKPMQKTSSGNSARKLFENNAVIQHNLKALNESGFDISSLNTPRRKNGFNFRF